MSQKPPTVNQKIAVVEPYYFDPSGVVPRGATGTVVKVETSEGQTQPTIHVKMDGSDYGLENGIMPFYPECGAQEDAGPGTVAWFHHHCDIVT